MATFSPKKIDLASINNGLQFENGDGISAEAINAPIEASAFVQTLAENKPVTRSNDGDISVSIETPDGTPVFVFENLVSQHELTIAKDNFAMDLDYLDNELRMIIAGKQDQLTIDTAVTEGSENPVTSGAVYEALQGIGGGGGNADGEVEPLPNTLVLRDENGFAEVLTPAITWGQEIDENQAHKVINAETLDNVARIVTSGCNDYVDQSVGEVYNVVYQQWESHLEDISSVSGMAHDNAMAIEKLGIAAQKTQQEVDFLYTLVEGTVVAHETIEDTFATRTTGGGIAVIDNTPTTVQKVQGTTRYSKNLFDLETAIGGSKTVNGITCVANNNTLTFSGTPTSSIGESTAWASFVTITNPSWLEVGKTYTLSQDKKYSYPPTGGGFAFQIQTKKPDGTTGYSTSFGGQYSFTVQEGYQYVFMLYTEQYPANVAMTPVTISFMFNEGSTALPYEDYAEGAINTKFSGIVSQNADGTKQDTLSIPPVELGAFDYIDVEKQQLIRQTISFAAADRTYGWCGTTPFNNSKNYFVGITFSGLPKVYAGQYSVFDVVCNHYTTASVTSILNNKCVTLGRTAQDVAMFSFRDDDLLVFNDDGTINNSATVDAFKAHFAEIGLRIAFKPSEVLATNDFACPKSYIAYSGGTETIIGGDEATVTQEYYVKVGG